MNITNNVSIAINEEAMQKIAEGFSTIAANMPKLITLTPDQRHLIPKMGDKTLAFVNKALRYAKQNPMLVPEYLDINEFTKDVDVINKSFRITAPLQKLVEEIDDTMMLAGSEAYASSLAFYTSLKAAIEAGVTGLKHMHDDMSLHFPGRGVKQENMVLEDAEML